MKKVVTIIIVLLLGLMAFLYLGNSGSSSTGSLSAQIQAPQSADAQYIYNLLQQMNSVSLDDTIFSDPTFTSLNNNTVILTPQAAGRPNPFAPLGSIGTVQTQSNTTNSTVKTQTNQSSQPLIP